MRVLEVLLEVGDHQARTTVRLWRASAHHVAVVVEPRPTPICFSGHECEEFVYAVADSASARAVARRIAECVPGLDDAATLEAVTQLVMLVGSN